MPVLFAVKRMNNRSCYAYLRPQLFVVTDLDQVLDLGMEHGQDLGLQDFCRLLHENHCWADDRENVGVHGRALQARDSVLQNTTNDGFGIEGSHCEDC